jgi:hypothetical protein
MSLTLLPLSAIALSQSIAGGDGSLVCQVPSIHGFSSFQDTIDYLKCEIVPTGNSPHFKKGLSTYWAQEYVGADLVREKLISENLSPKPSLVVAWDEGRHGKLVSNLMVGPTNSALIPGRSIPFSELHQKKDYKYIDSYNRLSGCLDTKDCPDYINNSMHWDNEGQEIANVVEKISEQSVFITIAGNNTSLVKSSKNDLATKNKLLVVGSIGPLGFGSDFSNYSDSLTISAPSDNLLTSEINKKLEKFGGTSGAAPQVSSALAAFSLISGYKLTTIEAKDLLQKTAMNFPHYPSPNSLGSGILNSYKISEVAWKLKKKCKNNQACFNEALSDEETYNFKIDAKKQLSKAKDIFPECFDQKNQVTIKKESCNERKELFNEIRKNALLNHHDSKAWDLISCISSNEGMTINAEFYKALSSRSKMNDEALIRKLVETGNAKDLFRFHLTHPSWSNRYEWVETFIKNPKNDNLIFNSILNRPELTNKFDWFNKLSSKPSNDLKIIMLLSTKGMDVHHKLLSDFIDGSNPSTDKLIVEMVLKNPKWSNHPELIEKIAKKRTADIVIEKMVNSSAEWKKVLTQRYHTELITANKLRTNNN